jgi:hypothetical protein
VNGMAARRSKAVYRRMDRSPDSGRWLAKEERDAALCQADPRIRDALFLAAKTHETIARFAETLARARTLLREPRRL